MGGRGYEDYVKNHRRDAELAEKVEAEINILDQLVTIFTITSSIATNPSHTVRLGQLQSLISGKRKAIQDVVMSQLHTLKYSVTLGNQEAGPTEGVFFLKERMANL